MTAAALYDAAVAFLEADVLAAVNAEQPGLLAAGSVTAARLTKNRFARRDKPHAATVEIVLFRRREETEGIGSDRVHLDFDLRCIVRRKDQSEGKEQARTADEIARAIVRRYRRTADLQLPVTGAALRYTDAHLLHVDDEPASGEVTRAVTRLTLTFSEALP